MAVVTLESSERSKRKARFKSTVRGSGTRHGDSFWTEEKERKNFGLSYMSKFGWSTGQGLGKDKQGNTSHVKTRYKNDTKGVGCNGVKSDTMFQATMCMFNDILSNLNQQKDKKKTDATDTSNATSTSSSSSSTQQHMSASAVIKSYEAKHHLYGRFRAAKMISNRSEQDKAELFGKVDPDTAGFTEQDQEQYATHLNDLAMQRSGKMGLGFHSNDDDRDNARGALLFGRFTSSGHITRRDLEGHDSGEKKTAETVVEDKKKSKKKKKKEKRLKSKDVESESIEIERAPDDVVDVEVETKKKKKKKKKEKKDKKKKNEDMDMEMNIAVHDTIEMNTTATLSIACEDSNETKSKKKKKDKKDKKKKRKRMLDSLDDGNMETSQLQQEPPSKKVKLDDNVSEISSTESILSALPTPMQSETEMEMESNMDAGDNDKKTKKKRKKKKDKSKKKREE